MMGMRQGGGQDGGVEWKGAKEVQVRGKAWVGAGVRGMGGQGRDGRAEAVAGRLWLRGCD